MDFFISSAYAQAAGAQQPGMFEAFMPLILIFIVFYFLLIRPQSKRAKEHKAMIAALGKGDEVVTTGGILGKVTNVGENFVTVEVADGVEMQVQKPAVASVMPKGTLKQAKD